MPEQPFPTPETWLEHRVSYGETDAMQQAYYGQYLHFFERARSQFIRERGMSYAEVERRGLFLPVREAFCRYRRPVRYDDLIWVRCGLEKWGRASVTFAYGIYDQDRARLMASGRTQHACTDAGAKPVPVPAWLRQLFVD